MKSKYFVMLLIIVMILNSLTISYGGIDSLLLSDDGTKVLGGLLIAGGMIYSTQEDLKNSVTDAYYNFMDSEMREDFNNAVAGAVNGVASFSSDIWNSVKSYVSSLSGTQATLQNYASYDGITYGASSSMSVAYNNIGIQGVAVGFGITNVYNEGTDNETYKWQVHIDGQYIDGTETVKEWSDGTYEYSIKTSKTYDFTSQYTPWWETWIDGDNNLIVALCYVESDGSIYRKDTAFRWRWEEIATGDYEADYGVAWDVPITGSQSYSYNIIATTGVASWDEWDNQIEEEEKVEVAIPSGLDDLIGDNWGNVKEKNYDDDIVVDDSTGSSEDEAGILSSIKEILGYLNPTSDTFFLKIAFVPSDGYFESYVNEIKTAFEDKIPIISQLYDFFMTVIDVSSNGGKPSFEFTLPSKYGGGTYELVDFSMYDDYRTYILNFIRFIAWFFFLKRLFKMLPNIVYR